ncbi:hypothetical protein, conserved [Babesia ovata]|uniref:RAP domain-containing protein n=1 Tax=Babesia ovata TaxID=189622 RepID=A0A2H6K9T1_9APIC|nr:uncharacterized protein BOVATA_012440 [Babesia ovata]GBE59751.1 hypothetical protein, conserved [Babesia ovata]
MGSRAARSLSNEWSGFCATFTSAQLSKVLNRIALNFGRLSQSTSFRREQCLKTFLEDHVLRSVSPTIRLEGGGKLGFEAVLQPLHQRILLLGRSGSLSSKDASLVLNAYAKVYQCTKQPQSTSKVQWDVVSRKLKWCAEQLLPVARRLVAEMNEQDLSLVLNCVSKLGLPANDLLNAANEALTSQLVAHYGHESQGDTNAGAPEPCSNVISQLTPQGASLVVNSFAKSDVALDDAVLNHIVHRFLPSHLEQFLPQQLAVLLHGFLKYNVPTKDLYSALKHLDRSMSIAPVESNPKLLSSALYTFGKYNYLPAELARQMELVRGGKPLRLSELELSNICYGMGKLRIRSEPFLEKLTGAVSRVLHELTPQGLSTVYYALSRLDIRDAVSEGAHVPSSGSVQTSIIHRFEELVELDRKSAPYAYVNRNISQQVLPLHIVNVCFSAATSLILDGGLFARLLRHLSLCFTRVHVSPHHSSSHINIASGNGGDTEHGANGHAPDVVSLNGNSVYVEEATTTEDRACAFLTTSLGTQGTYQLFCICQHIAGYALGGLSALGLEELKLLSELFRAWERISRDKPSAFLSEDPTRSVVLVDPDITTSKIQSGVFAVLKTMLSRSSETREGKHDSGLEDQCSKDKETIVVAESHATPTAMSVASAVTRRLPTCLASTLVGGFPQKSALSSPDVFKYTITGWNQSLTYPVSPLCSPTGICNGHGIAQRSALTDPFVRLSDGFFTHVSQIECPRPLQVNLELPNGPYPEIRHQPVQLPAVTTESHHVVEDQETGVYHIYDVGPAYLFNKLRTDTKHRKRAFTKRGYFRQSRSITRKENRMKFAYALQGIDYEMLEGLKRGEIPDIRAYKR